MYFSGSTGFYLKKVRVWKLLLCIFVWNVLKCEFISWQFVDVRVNILDIVCLLIDLKFPRNHIRFLHPLLSSEILYANKKHTSKYMTKIKNSSGFSKADHFLKFWSLLSIKIINSPIQVVIKRSTVQRPARSY